MSISDASTSSYDSYDEPADIYRKVVEEKKSAYVSPAGLAAKKTKKEAVKYLKEKGCPDVESLRRSKQNPPPAVEPEMDRKMPVADQTVSRHATIGAPKKSKKAEKAVEAPTVPEVKVTERLEAPKVTVAAPAERLSPGSRTAVTAEKPKRELTAYQRFVQEQRKAGKSMAEAAAAWKASKA
jgi:hypothetical protein